MPQITKAQIHYELYLHHTERGYHDWADLHWDLMLRFAKVSTNPNDKSILTNY